jgi:hypothetical protein
MKNGMLNKIIFGEVREQRLRTREVTELKQQQYIGIAQVLENINAFADTMDELKTYIT